MLSAFICIYSWLNAATVLLCILAVRTELMVVINRSRRWYHYKAVKSRLQSCLSMTKMSVAYLGKAESRSTKR